MTALDPARRDAAVVALALASTRLERVVRVVKPRADRDPAAQRLLTICEIVAPVLVAIENMLPEPTK